MDLVLFDLDNTLLSGDSDYEWGQFLVARGVVDGAAYEARNLAFYEQYKAGTLDIHEFLDFQLAPLASHPRADLDRWHAEFMERSVTPLISNAAKALVQDHLQGDAVVAIVTATNSFVTGPIARAFGVQHLIATVAARENGRFTGKPRGVPAFQGGKITRVTSWLESLGLDMQSFGESWFYSDSHNDLPLLEQVSKPVAVDPDDTLRAHAEAKGWQILSLRAAP